MDIIIGWTIFVVVFTVVWMMAPQGIREEVVTHINKQFSGTVGFIIQQFQGYNRRIPMVPGVIQVRSPKTKVVSQYKNSAGVVFRPGDRVKLSSKAFVTKDPSPPLRIGRRIIQGKIVSLFSDVPGLVLVEPRLGGFHTWDVNDLKRVDSVHKSTE